MKADGGIHCFRLVCLSVILSMHPSYIPFSRISHKVTYAWIQRGGGGGVDPPEKS